MYLIKSFWTILKNIKKNWIYIYNKKENTNIKDIIIAAAQFENKNGDKNYNLNVIRELSKNAKNLTKNELLNVAEKVPEGKSVKKLMEISKELNIIILAGLFEKDEKDI